MAERTTDPEKKEKYLSEMYRAEDKVRELEAKKVGIRDRMAKDDYQENKSVFEIFQNMGLDKIKQTAQNGVAGNSVEAMNLQSRILQNDKSDMQRIIELVKKVADKDFSVKIDGSSVSA